MKNKKIEVRQRQPRLKIVCPVHHDETLHRLHYNVIVARKPTKANKRGLVGHSHNTDLFYCARCKKARKVTIAVGK